MWEEFKKGLATYLSPEIYVNIFGVAIKIIAIVVAARLIMRLAHFFVNRVFVESPIKGIEYNPKRVQTLKSLALSVMRYTLYFLAITMILEEFNFPVSSLLAGAGILGLAVGFGAQNLVKDVISGFFILAENQFSVGEHVMIENIEGIVEEIGIRTTKVKAFEGQIHIIPNGQINIVTNYTSTKSMRVLFDVGIAYEENLQRAMEVLEKVCADFGAANSHVVDGPRVLGIQEFGDYSIQVRIIGYTVPGEQWGVERALKKEIKRAFDREGISFPYPKQVFCMETSELGATSPGGQKFE